METTTQRRVTKRQAEAALAAVRREFKSYIGPMGEPKLNMDWDGHVAILWEDGPSEWAHRAVDGGTSEDERILMAQAAEEFGIDPKAAVARLKPNQPIAWPKGVEAEPYFSFVLCLYPA